MGVLLQFNNWKNVVEILILWFIIYHIFVFLQGTRAAYLLRGIIILIVCSFVFQKFDFPALSWIFSRLYTFFLILIAIIFQPELRDVLIKLGKKHFFYTGPKKEEIEKILREIASAISSLSGKKIGALIAIRREMELKDYIESGIALNADISSEFLQNIFHPPAPLHDGGVIIEGTKIIAAACLFPLSENSTLDKSMGMRHRAAVGLSERSDALVISVSEETGLVSLAINGQLTRDLSSEDLLTILKGQLSRQH